MNHLNHVAIIMDGNGRWGLKKYNSRKAGHKAGLKTVEKIIKETINQKIKFLTLYAFSTENWKRPKNEIIYLFGLLENFLINKINELQERIIDKNIINFTIVEKENEINIFFDNQTYDLIGWQNTDIYQNFNITFISSIRKNRLILKNIFKLPAPN